MVRITVPSFRISIAIKIPPLRHAEIADIHRISRPMDFRQNPGEGGAVSRVTGGLIVPEFSFHPVQSGGGVVQLNLPVLGAPVVFSQKGGGVFQSGTKGFDLPFLGFNLPVQHLIPGGEGFHRAAVF